jgi:hypothetical protein
LTSDGRGLEKRAARLLRESLCSTSSLVSQRLDEHVENKVLLRMIESLERFVLDDSGTGPMGYEAPIKGWKTYTDVLQHDLPCLSKNQVGATRAGSTCSRPWSCGALSPLAKCQNKASGLPSSGGKSASATRPRNEKFLRSSCSPPGQCACLKARMHSSSSPTLSTLAERVLPSRGQPGTVSHYEMAEPPQGFK